MPIKSRSIMIGLCLITASLTGCAGKAIPATTVPLPLQSGQEYVLGPGDVIRLSLYGDDSFSGDYVISESHNISLPLIGSVNTAGKTISQVEEAVTAILANGYYSDPRVSATVAAYRPFYILGEVNRPGTYPFVAGLTLEKAVATAGGYSYRANSRAILLQRTGSSNGIKVKTDTPIIIGPGDTVKILERYF